MVTKYIVNNATGQTITGGLSFSGKTSILSTPPTSLSGTTGDKKGDLAFDEDYLYYCKTDFDAAGYVVTSDGPSHVFYKNSSLDWMSYYIPPSQYALQTGYDENKVINPQTGWYIIDDNYEIKQVVSGFGTPEPIPNGAGWLMTLDGPFTISSSRPSITFYETLPTVTYNEGSGDIWKTVKLDAELNTIGVYNALLTQTESITGTSIGDFDYGLIIGEAYTISNYVVGDDFSNIANVISGNINETGCIFLATGQVPENWANNSELVSSGNLVVDVLENSLGYDLDWSHAPFGSVGYYVAINNQTGPLINSFPRQNVAIKAHVKQPLNWGFPSINIYPQIISFGGKDDAIILNVVDYDLTEGIDNALYYTPVEINIKRDIDTTPIVLSGSVTSSYPFYNAAVDLFCGPNYVDSLYSFGQTVNDLAELVTYLNTDQTTSSLGTFADDGSGNIILTMRTNLKNQFCSDSTLTFEVYND